jgi:two-component system, LytTR family, response regulator
MTRPLRSVLRVVVADDERPARKALLDLLDGCADLAVVGEAQNGLDAVRVIEREQPDLALLDLQMPEIDGMSAVRLIRRERLPLVAFVTAYDQYAVEAFELNAIDYLLKPIEPARLQRTLDRARDRLESRSLAVESSRLRQLAARYGRERPQPPLARLPIRKGEDIVLVPMQQVASLVAEGELLHVTTRANERHTLTHRLKDIEARLDPARFVRVERGAVVAIDAIARVSALPGGTYLIVLTNGQEIRASRLQSRVLREQLLRL